VSPAAGALSREPIAMVARACALVLPLFCLVEVNYPQLSPQSELAIFAALGVAIVLLGGRGPAPSPDGGRLRTPVAEGEPAAAPAAPPPAPSHPRRRRFTTALSALAALAFAAVCLYIVVQTEPALSSWWSDGRSLGDRAGAETALDLIVGVAGLALILIATHRALGWALPTLALAFLAYARWGSALPDWLLPHRGYGVERIVAQTFLHSQGVFGVALNVMFTYVFPFLVFGALLEASGATGYILDVSRRLLGKTRGGAAKVAVVASGLMGSLSGSAVANTATTGTFTIPMMRAAGFAPHTAAGLEAAASSGGALVPPVMGAGAYMMLEIVTPPVTYLQIVRAALIPSILYYLSLFLVVHFRAHRLHTLNLSNAPTPSSISNESPAPLPAPSIVSVGQGGVGRGASSQGRQTRRTTERDGRPQGDSAEADEGRANPNPHTQSAPRPLGGGPSAHPGGPITGGPSAHPGGPATPTFFRWEGAVFLGALLALITLLLLRYSVPRAVTWSMAAVLALAALHPRTRLTPRSLAAALTSASRGGVALIAAAAAVGVVLGVVTLTGAGSRLPALLLPRAQDHLPLALVALMLSSLVLGMGLPSAVCYLLLATLVGPVLGQLGVVPLAAHLFIFYFGMMSMVTPPVALAAYTAGSIAGAGIWASSMAAFRFSLIGFVLPFLFVYHPELLMLEPAGGTAAPWAIVAAAAVTALGIVPLAAAAAGWLGRPLGIAARAALFAAAALALAPTPSGAPLAAAPLTAGAPVSALNLAGLALTAGVWAVARWMPHRRSRRS
jgi:TRAP transporter 4TM/12TM fusion protein